MLRKANFSLLFEDIQRLSPLLVVRLLLSLTAYSPWLIYALFTSWQQMQHWRQVQTCQALIARHRLAFAGVDEATLTVEWQSGGVSNVNQIWRCRKSSGEAVNYFVKVFVPVGSFWAKHLSLEYQFSNQNLSTPELCRPLNPPTPPLPPQGGDFELRLPPELGGRGGNMYY